jgi:signal transduction histidine kinase
VQVECTETELEQVFLNLLRNAAQAMSMGESPPDDPRIVVRLSNLASGVRCEVEDNGPGMPPEIVRRVFEPFYTTKAPGVGTGLGLSVSYFIVTRGHGGKMWVESAPGAGSRFVIELPASGLRKQDPDFGRT